jgi:hypothetical protein
MSTLQLVSEIRVFSIIHILLCISIVVAANYSSHYFGLLIKIWAVLLIFSAGRISRKFALFL